MYDIVNFECLYLVLLVTLLVILFAILFEILFDTREDTFGVGGVPEMSCKALLLSHPFSAMFVPTIVHLYGIIVI